MTAPDQTPPPLDLDPIQAELDAITNLAPAAEDSTGSLANQRATRAWANLGRHVPALLRLAEQGVSEGDELARELAQERTAHQQTLAELGDVLHDLQIAVGTGYTTAPSAAIEACRQIANLTRDRDGARDALRRVQERYDEVRAAQERLVDDQESIHTRLLDVLERTGWIEPEQRDRIDPLGAAVLAADGLVQASNAKQAVMQMSNDTLARLREPLLAALGAEDDGRTGLDEYIRQLIAQRDEARQLVDDLRDPDPCWYDHHGYCQAHGWTKTDPPCPDARAAELFAEGGEGR